ncbi:AraC-type DNA-binding protein [Tenacibaculum sp. MAR_2009_124]|uniref:helix-turn-helix domain-containing protein n=1 Tax=Tenacibaculum sp. MAR_2009_124 TaxID=1250059 RepID=UPI00089AC750|nr:AraC family transcriptional regulator [Tenacibaculum sp. MAR_2009_124]SED15648.1 AraC-type DNA-binding protein [Tenacibaculum sp. MAR_2009_124]
MKFSYTGEDEATFDLIDTTNLSYSAPKMRGDCYKIIWAKNDELHIGVDGYSVLLQKNQMLFCTPLNLLDFEVQNKEIVIYSFNREFYCIRDHDNEVSCNGLLFLGSSAPVVVKLNEKEQQSFSLLYNFFIEEFETIDHIQGEMLLVLLKRLLIKSLRIAKKTLPHPDMPQPKLDTIRKFNLLVEMHFREKHKVSEYANIMNLTSKSLSNIFTRYYNKSPLKIINERIILESKRLLSFSEKNINEISFELGFEEASHFSKFFKTHVGKSPNFYKKANINRE